jgi:hypothetical protein
MWSFTGHNPLIDTACPLVSISMVWAEEEKIRPVNRSNNIYERAVMGVLSFT